MLLAVSILDNFCDREHPATGGLGHANLPILRDRAPVVADALDAFMRRAAVVGW